MAIIHNVRGGTVGLNEEDRLMIARLLIKVGYSVKIGHQQIPGNAKGKRTSPTKKKDNFNNFNERSYDQEMYMGLIKK